VNVARVADRVRRGGHNVPTADIERRYWRSLAHLPEMIPKVDRTIIFDASSRLVQTPVLAFSSATLTWSAASVPQWLVARLPGLLPLEGAT
jgi:predicted ABC-type ATPase